jgi:hypothetical protein
MSRTVFLQVASFCFYLLVQVLILKTVVLFNTAFCFLYIVFLLTLPFDTNPLLLMIAGFILGIAVDSFYDSLGLHAFACVLIAYIRNYWLAVITPQGGYDAGATPALSANGVQWFLVYSLPLVVVHHFTLFYLEAAGFLRFWSTLLKVFSSIIFTLTIILILQYTFSNRRRI